MMLASRGQSKGYDNGEERFTFWRHRKEEPIYENDRET